MVEQELGEITKKNKTTLLRAKWDRKLRKAMIMHILKGHGTQKKKNHNESQFHLY